MAPALLGDAPVRIAEEMEQQFVPVARRTKTRWASGAAAALVLSLGVGANTAVFNVANHLFLRSPPGVFDPSSLVVIRHGGQSGASIYPISYPDVETLRTELPALTDLAATVDVGVLAVNMVVGDGVARRVNADVVTSNYFDVLGVPMAAGRRFSAVEGRDPQAAPAAVISQSLQTSMFGGRNAVGRSVRVNGAAVSIVGVAGDGFRGATARHVDVWVPAAQRALTIRSNDPGAMFRNRRMGIFFTLVGRLKSGERLTTVQAQVPTAQARLVRDSPLDQRLTERRIHADDAGALTRDREELRPILPLFFGLSFVVLLAACAGAGNAAMARAYAGRGALAIRRILGASPVAAARGVFTEIVLLAIFTAVGATVASWTVATLLEGTVLLPGQSPLSGIGTTWISMSWVAAVSCAATLAVGLGPIALALRTSPHRLLHDKGSRQSASAAWGHRCLGAIEIALSIVLVSASVLLVRSVHAKLSVNPGFDAGNIVSFALDEDPAESTSSGDSRREFVDALRNVPGVISATLAFQPPLYADVEARLTFRTQDSTSFNVPLNSVAPGYFSTLGLPFVAGRDFDPGEITSKEPVSSAPLILTESLATRLFDRASPLGQEITLSNGSRRTVIGVVGNIRQRRLSDPRATMVAFEPLRPAVRLPWTTATLRLTDGRSAPWEEVSRLVARTFPNRAMFDVQAATDGIRREFSTEILAMRLALGFGCLSLVVAATGISSAITRRLHERRRELGIRAAVGAGPAHLAWQVARESAVVLFAGCVIGTVAAFWVSSVVRHVIPVVELGVSSIGTSAFIVITLAALAAGYSSLAAAWISPRETQIQ